MALTDGSLDCYSSVWSLDGTAVGFYGRPYRHTKELQAEMYRYELEKEQIAQMPVSREIEDAEPFILTEDGGVIFASYEREKGGVSLKLF